MQNGLLPFWVKAYLHFVGRGELTECTVVLLDLLPFAIIKRIAILVLPLFCLPRLSKALRLRRLLYPWQPAKIPRIPFGTPLLALRALTVPFILVERPQY